MADTEPRRFRRALITGGTGGIGAQIANDLSSQVSTLILPGRNQTKAAQEAAELRGKFPALTVETEELDLGSLASVRALCTKLGSATAPIDLLILNAGIVPLGQAPSKGADGWGLVFETNYLGHFALIQGLLPLLSAGNARVVIQLSLAADYGKLNWVQFRDGTKQRALHAYQQSKIALGLLGMELERRSRSEGWGISVQLCHPGIVPGSDIAPHLRSKIPSGVVDWVSHHLGNSITEAALPAVDAALTDRGQVTMFAPSNWFETSGPVIERAPFKTVTDERDADVLWSRSLALLHNSPAWSTPKGGATEAPS